jgi:hypothetical protein
MHKGESQLPDIDRKAVEAWQSELSPDYLHETSWPQVNTDWHQIVMGARRFAQKHYPDDPQRRTDFLDGVAYGLSGVTYAKDLEILKQKFVIEDTNSTGEDGTSIIPKPRENAESSGGYDAGEDRTPGA